MTMTFTQLKDVLRRIKDVHYELSNICQEDRVADRRARLLVQYVSRWEERLGRYLDRLEPAQRQAFLSTWVQFAGTEGIERALEAVRQASAEEPDKLLEKALGVQEEIAKALGHLAEQLNARDVRERLGALAELEHKATRELSSAIVMVRDA
jgi:hypothetical protein